MALTNIYAQEHHQLIARLRLAREEAGLTQIEVAKKLGVGQSAISEIELGQRRINFTLLTNLSRIYKTPFVVFISSRVSITDTEELEQLVKRKHPKLYKSFMAVLKGLF